MRAREQGRGSASGKIILFGEHAVVYGVPAIAAGISRGAEAVVREAHKDQITVDGEAQDEQSELFLALRLMREELGAPPASVELSLAIPKGAGLGASAAMAVATARALVDLKNLSDEEAYSERRMLRAAHVWEAVFHENPSGVDVAAAQGQSPISFRRGEEPERLVLGTTLHLAIAQAGPPASTKEMVSGVARFKQRNPAQFQRTLDGIASLVDNALLLLRQGDLRSVGKLMDLNQMLLSGWMLSTEQIERACHLAREAGALGAKLTGSGGGGCVIALSDPRTDAETPCTPILSAWEAAGIPCFSATIAGVA